MLQTEVDGISVRTARDGGPCLFEGSIAADGIALMMGIDAAGKICGNGIPFGPRSVLLSPGRTTIQSTSLDAVFWMSVFIPASRLQTQSPLSEELPTRPGRVIEVPTQEYAELRNLLWRIIAATKAGAFASNPAGQHDAAFQLTRIVASIATGPGVCLKSDRAVGRPRWSRLQIMDRARAVVEAHSGTSLHVNELASAVGVSIRTLNNAFQEQMGISPRCFVRVCTLNAARSALRLAEQGDVKVSEIAARLGIWEWGRFSRDYRMLFGELPSETLRGRRGSSSRTLLLKSSDRH